MANQEFKKELSPLFLSICQAYRADETECVNGLLELARLQPQELERVQEVARTLVVAVRKRRLAKGGMDAFLFQYDLSSEEGIALMCLSEALLRIPDANTVDKLIKDKLTQADWEQHLGKSNSSFVNAATWALMLTGKVISNPKTSSKNLSSVLQRLTKRSGEPIIRQAVGQAMRILGRQFVMGETITSALKRAQALEKKGFRYSYDMLGEAACTMEDAEVYFQSYITAIKEIGRASNGFGPIKGPGISVKLSALHPRYEWGNRQRMMGELLPRLKQLIEMAKEFDIGFTIDAEESDRLDLSLELIEEIIKEPSFRDWRGFGFAVQAYQKRATQVLDWVIELARKYQQPMMIRLVKGAYWDSEIKWAQERGLSGYPVFTRKASTDVSYIACIKKLFAATDIIYPQFATHNAYTVAVVLELAKGCREFEFQCLHGMGDALYANVVEEESINIPCRIYAPVGGHENLLAYLVRRLLENGANTSFVNRIVDEQAPIEEIIADPCKKIQLLTEKNHPQIPLPENLYGDTRLNSKGVDISNPLEILPLLNQIERYTDTVWTAKPSLALSPEVNQPQVVSEPRNTSITVGNVFLASSAEIESALEAAAKAAVVWEQTEPNYRAECLDNMAGLLEQHKPELMALLVREAGKTVNDAIAEVREAVDFCRYYAKKCREDFQIEVLQGPTGEHNQIRLTGRGVIACISPWNFPLAIFTGQVIAAIAAGNAVIAKPASQTPLIAAKTIELLHLAGIPKEVAQLLPGTGGTVGAALIKDLRISGVMFTGSTETARSINQTLANRQGPIVPFVAETGGQNAMIVDSSALPEQVVKDVVLSAFGSAGQRCSALRVLYVQSDVADRMITMLQGAMAELSIGDPLELSTDVGPVIDEAARTVLQSHVETMKQTARLIFELSTMNPDLTQGTYFGPSAFEISSIKDLRQEVFGPVLHIVRFEEKDLGKIIEDINQVGYGLTLGVHSRIDHTVDFITQHAKVGNIYINRNMIGAVVGVQPFGGEGLSGTGPKAGGPRYLHRLATERTLSINTAAAGGNATLMSLRD